MLRKINKNLLLVVLVIAMIASLSGCTTKVENTTSTNERGYANPDSIVTAKELKEMKDVVVVDFTKSGGKYIPGAVRIERASIAAEVDGVAGMIASKEAIEKVLREAGIDNDDTVVIYDADKELWAARLWWVMKVYGHEDVRLLDGGLDAWLTLEYATEGDPASKEATKYKAKKADEDLIAGLELVKKSYENDKLMVLDTRSDKEWKDGHIPGAVHIEWTQALNEDGTFKNADELKKIYGDQGITKDLEAIMPHCKSAVRAAHTMFALQELLGYENVKNYDGSWLEYSVSGETVEK